MPKNRAKIDLFLGKIYLAFITRMNYRELTKVSLGRDVMNQQIISHIRRSILTTGKEKPFLYSLKDDELYNIYERLRNRESTRAIARYLITKLDLNVSENSLAQAIAKVQKRISALLKGPVGNECISATDLGDKSTNLNVSAQIKRLRSLADSYARQVDQAIDQGRKSGLIPEKIDRHMAALGSVVKTLSQLEEEDEVFRLALLREAIEDLRNRMSDYLIHEFIAEDREKMAQVAHDFLVEASKHAMLVVKDEITGKYFTKAEIEAIKKCEIPKRFR
jgi:hypothetical protein